jgi:outer membrane protease
VHESFAVINLRGVSTNKTIIICFIAMQTYKELKLNIIIIWQLSITSGEMANCDWLRSTYNGPLFSRNRLAVHCVKTNACILKQNSKTN